MPEGESLMPETNLQKEKERKLKKFFESIDQKGTLFAYGSLLDPQNLKRLLDGTRDGEAPEVYETNDLEKASTLSKENPSALIILRNVLLEGIRAQIITDKQLLSAFEKKFGESYSVDNNNPEQYLYVRTPLKKEKALKNGEKIETPERGRPINGGVIICFSGENLPITDKKEGMGKKYDRIGWIYMRQSVPQITIDNAKFIPENIEFYGGNVGDIHIFIDPENSEKSRLSAIRSVAPKVETSERKLGELPESAYWPHSPEHSVRRKYDLKE
jgi:hypothetical protein